MNIANMNGESHHKSLQINDRCRELLLKIQMIWVKIYKCWDFMTKWLPDRGEHYAWVH